MQGARRIRVRRARQCASDKMCTGFGSVGHPRDRQERLLNDAFRKCVDLRFELLRLCPWIRRERRESNSFSLEVARVSSQICVGVPPTGSRCIDSSSSIAWMPPERNRNRRRSHDRNSSNLSVVMLRSP